MYTVTACSDVEASSRDSVLDTMIVAASLGTASLIAIWSYLGYKVYKRYSEFCFNLSCLR